tara:strand:+ start:149 stop:640 length:492 start_codon:yes stop_codon:yes gene_type:complete
MPEIIKIQKVLHFKDVGRKKKTVTFCSNNVSKADVERVSKIRANKGSNKGDSTMMFGSKPATGYTALPNFGVNYYVALDTTGHKVADLPKVGDKHTLEVFNEFTEDTMKEIYLEDESLQLLDKDKLHQVLVRDYLHLSVPFKPVVNEKGTTLTNCFWGYLVKN